MSFVPIFVQLRGRRCLMVGGGEIAARKVKSLLQAGAGVTVISPDLTGALKTAAEAGRIEYLARSYRPGDMRGFTLVYAAVGDPRLAGQLYEEASRLAILINVADRPEACSFIVPAVARRGNLQVAISTQGASPALAGRLRAWVEACFGPEFDVLIELLAAARAWLKTHENDPVRRAERLRELAGRDLAAKLIGGDFDGIQAALSDCLGSRVDWEDLGLEPGALRDELRSAPLTGQG